MPGFAVQITEDTVMPALDAFLENMRENVAQELDIVGANMEELAKSLVPVRTGYLWSTIFHSVQELALTLGATADYAAYVEYGTRFMGARPYIRPALDGLMPQLADAIAIACQKAWEGR